MQVENFIEEGQHLTKIGDCNELKKEYDVWCGEIKRFLRKQGLIDHNL